MNGAGLQRFAILAVGTHLGSEAPLKTANQRPMPYGDRMTPENTVILLAEDDLLVRNLVQLMLAKEGFILLSASDGQQALELFEAFKDPIHLLLTDIRMPRLDGLTLAERVRALRPETKIIIMSGDTAVTIREHNVPDAFLRKPFVPPILLKCIQRVLKGGSGACEEICEEV